MLSQEMIYGILARIEGGFAGVRAEIQATREASEERNRGIHKRMDRFEDHTRSEFREIRSKMERVKAPPSPTSFLKVAGSLLAHWQILLTVLFVLVGVALGKSPDTIKAWVGALK